MQRLVKQWKLVRKNRNIKLSTKDDRRNYLVLGSNYQVTKWFLKKILVIEMKLL